MKIDANKLDTNKTKPTPFNTYLGRFVITVFDLIEQKARDYFYFSKGEEGKTYTYQDLVKMVDGDGNKYYPMCAFFTDLASYPQVSYGVGVYQDDEQPEASKIEVIKYERVDDGCDYEEVDPFDIMESDPELALFIISCANNIITAHGAARIDGPCAMYTKEDFESPDPTAYYHTTVLDRHIENAYFGCVADGEDAFSDLGSLPQTTRPEVYVHYDTQTRAWTIHISDIYHGEGVDFNSLVKQAYDIFSQDEDISSFNCRMLLQFCYSAKAMLSDKLNISKTIN